ncbi:Bfr1 binding protein [Schizosaccharomyces cryophilus OY26]|uniref:Bfr1 binding protein n=1 Tax=Schizosaccharomyces cryophilus (strain OY26 / ATCC MYA-4695 / CBS 11777 / NBRC 106824 / NRRL Y48691) TaxID=653667 RepID=S9VXH9_SCHCR|nr:Bfr1 binding protein [Schizosaccharomyces cryophilus OY26]EPY50889.1 Bfr1 binding protein [Schizosaccharomyces cryophilus OY26]
MSEHSRMDSEQESFSNQEKLIDSFLAKGPQALAESASSSVNEQSGLSTEQELKKYKEFFSQLKFSYIEQGTKERYLRAILDDPPLLVEPEDNEKLESTISELKFRLKQRKDEVESLKKEIVSECNEIAQKYDATLKESKEAKTLLAELRTLEKELQDLDQDNLIKTPILPDLEEKIPVLEQELLVTDDSIKFTNSQLERDEVRLDQLRKNCSLLEKEYSHLHQRSNHLRESMEMRSPGDDAKRKVQAWYTSMLNIYDQILP